MLLNITVVGSRKQLSGLLRHDSFQLQLQQDAGQFAGIHGQLAHEFVNVQGVGAERPANLFFRFGQRVFFFNR